VLIAEAELLARWYLAEMVGREPDMEVVGAVGDGQEAVAQVTLLQPDILLLDLCLPKLDGLEAARQLGQRGVPTRVLAR
jgi:DNA-binding NarL/FixJ family response regulator